MPAFRTVSTAEAQEEATRLRVQHGYCVGMSAGANMLVARALAKQGLSVATVWPDCSDRYVSMGLAPPASTDVQCPLRAACAERTRQMLGDQAPSAEGRSHRE